MNTVRRYVTVVLHVKKLRVMSDFIYKVAVITTLIEKKPLVYADLQMQVAKTKQDLVALKKAEEKVQTRLRGTAAQRDAVYNKVMNGVWVLLRGVQDLVDREPDSMKATALAKGAGFDVKKPRKWNKPPLEARLMNSPGTVKLIAKAAGKDDTYEWQQSLNDGKSWTELRPTHQATTIVTGLLSGKKYWFRYRVVLKKGVSGWSEKVTAVVQ